MTRPTREEFETFLQAHLPNSSVRAEEHATRIDPRDPAQPVCDFCGTVPAVRRYGAQDIETGRDPVMGRWMSIGDWGACNTCQRLIDNDDRRALEDHCVARMRLTYPDTPSFVIRAGIRRAQRKFYQARKK